MEERDESQEEEAKKATYSELLAQILRQNLDAEDALRVSKELLLINPDHYHAWNRRKEALLKTDPSLASLIVNELEFSVEALKLNPKSYPSWYHRRWLLGTVQPEIARAIAPNELRLCSKLLQLDARNFHCWNYRAFLCDELLRRSCEEELVFSKEMIGSNFSNYSAWHRRAVVISRLDPNSTNPNYIHTFRENSSCEGRHGNDKVCHLYGSYGPMRMVLSSFLCERILNRQR